MSVRNFDTTIQPQRIFHRENRGAAIHDDPESEELFGDHICAVQGEQSDYQHRRDTLVDNRPSSAPPRRVRVINENLPNGSTHGGSRGACLDSPSEGTAAVGSDDVIMWCDLEVIAAQNSAGARWIYAHRGPSGVEGAVVCWSTGGAYLP